VSGYRADLAGSAGVPRRVVKDPEPVSDERCRLFARCAPPVPRTPPTQPRLCTFPNSPHAKKPAPRTPHEPSCMTLSSPCLIARILLTHLSLPLPPSQALVRRWCAGCPPCEALCSPPPASPPTLVGGSDTFSSQITRMHIVLLRGMHVLTSRARVPVSSSRVACPCALVPRLPLWVHVVGAHL
jgi:hypothetical protein